MKVKSKTKWDRHCQLSLGNPSAETTKLKNQNHQIMEATISNVIFEPSVKTLEEKGLLSKGHNREDQAGVKPAA